ncbi:hypothetical protein TTMV3_gp3 [Torque teno mini virus 3]|uniref:DUF755 domain-containing protein n=1 Tax=Torque teno mini virus 3 TaxID=687371 RepID=Q9JG49_9VIRU|nr:hypothetical protein TTMV3_gp3 [Torque teno mini virus 3]BAA93610.1 unnamed protein product [Torque teno mini virus 3]
MLFMTFFLSGEDAQHQWKKSKTPVTSHTFPSPLKSLKDVKSRIQTQTNQNTYTASTKDDKFLQKLLKKEYVKTLNLKHLCSQMDQNSTSQYSNKKKKHRRHRARKKQKHHYSRSSSSSSDTRESSSESSSD